MHELVSNVVIDPVAYSNDFKHRSKADAQILCEDIDDGLSMRIPSSMKCRLVLEKQRWISSFRLAVSPQ